MMSRKGSLCGLALAVALLGWGRAEEARGGTITYSITADTSSATGDSGVLDFQFNPQDSGGTDTAAVTAFASDGTVGSVVYTTGSESDDLSNLPVTLTDDQPTNELTQAFVFGTTLQFSLTVTTNDTSPGASFYFTMFDSSSNNGNGSFIDAGPNGESAVEIDVAPGGASQVQLYGPGASESSNTNAVAPEPASVVLLALGGFCLMGYVRRHRAVGVKEG